MTGFGALQLGEKLCVSGERNPGIVDDAFCKWAVTSRGESPSQAALDS